MGTDNKGWGAKGSSCLQVGKSLETQASYGFSGYSLAPGTLESMKLGAGTCPSLLTAVVVSTRPVGWKAKLFFASLWEDSSPGPQPRASPCSALLGKHARHRELGIPFSSTGGYGRNPDGDGVSHPQVLETCVKNCGHRFHVLVASQDFVEGVLVRTILPRNNPPSVVHDKVLSLIQVRCREARSVAGPTVSTGRSPTGVSCAVCGPSVSMSGCTGHTE